MKGDEKEQQPSLAEVCLPANRRQGRDAEGRGGKDKDQENVLAVLALLGGSARRQASDAAQSRLCCSVGSLLAPVKSYSTGVRLPR